MERRFEIQKRKILKEADIKPQVFNGMLKRLEQFVKPFIACLGRREPKENAHIYISGLLSDLARKNIESIAYRYDQDRRDLQAFRCYWLRLFLAKRNRNIKEMPTKGVFLEWTQFFNKKSIKFNNPCSIPSIPCGN